MKIQLQPPTPYQDSLIWKIQDSYFKQKGKAAWKDGEVPFNISCNSRLAYQNARVIFEAAMLHFRQNPAEKIYILELGAGSGIFSLNFVRAFREICSEENKQLYHNLHYMISDYSEKNLLDISENKELQKLQEQGLVDYYLLDVLNFSEMKKLNGEKYELREKQLTAAISNYLHCNLPVAVLRKQGNSFFEKQLELYLDSKKKVNDINVLVNELLSGSADREILNRLIKKTSFKKIALEDYIKDKTALAVIEDYFRKSDNVTFNYPFASLSLLRRLLYLMKQDGLIFISDKSYTEEKPYLEQETKEVINANSFSHTVNLPLFARYALKLGAASLIEKDSEDIFHTLLLANNTSINRKTEGAFTELFLKENLNKEIFKDYRQAKYYLKGETEKALKFYLQILKYLPSESWLLYNTGTCYLELKKYFEAIKYLSLGKTHDSFNFHDFDIPLGMAWLNLQKFELALEHFSNSVSNTGENPDIYYFIALCYQFMGETEQAVFYFKKSLTLNPGSKDVKVALDNLKNRN